ncbi:MAG: hypothetical protein JNN33_14930 [Rhodospirillaceae bacterium]|jgi:uncharacterized protein|nr:hypothetical protein [Rhodospirillaceae bacterium]
MFTLPTLPKILLIVAVIGVIWWWHRRNQIKARERAELDRNPRAGKAKGGAKGAAGKPIEDMTQCKVCGAYVPAKGATRCGRADCPF